MSTNQNEKDKWNELNIDEADLQQLLEEQQVTDRNAQLDEDGFDLNCGNSWIYPSNMPCRSYQCSIAQASLFKNTLVVLPTGLGKTFIAAVVMYNFYRWYPKGKVIFLAPTRPLVAQQISACQRVMPFVPKDVIELTGKLQKQRRAELWSTKRVFFATPQVVQSDIMSAINVNKQTYFPFESIRLLVIDEAHRAKGRYAYTEVVNAIWQRNKFFRVLALSATPGRTIDDVVEVVRNLLISHLEVRWENSVDVVPYIHKRTMKTVVVPLSKEIKLVREELIQIIDPYLRQLIDAGVLSGSLRNISRNYLLFEQKSFRERSMTQRHPQQAAVNSNFSTCISLYHSLELLERHGLRAFLHSFDEDEEGKSKYTIAMDGKLRSLVERLRSKLGPNPFDISTHAMTNGQLPEMPKNLDFGHPKFEEARKYLLEHFEMQPESRAIVFCEYRESVMLIYRLLLQHMPKIRPRCFVGQGGTNGSIRALTQKQQLQIMNDFRSGKSNVLVATSIGEEGIDVGEVDLIVCFDISTSNPQRFVQRIGRTGRQRQGKVIMLVTEGRERTLMKEVLANRDQTNRRLLNSSVLRSAYYINAPRMIPQNLSPKCQKVFITPPEPEKEKQVKPGKREKQEKPISAAKGRRTSKRKSNEKCPEVPSSQDLRKFFKKSTPEKGETASQSSQTLPIHSAGKFMEHLNATELPDVSKHQTPAHNQKELKRIRKINKLLRSAASAASAKVAELSLQDHFLSESLSDELKLSLLKAQPEFVNQLFEQMEILQAVVIEPEFMCAEEIQLRATYEVIERLFGSKQALTEFLDDFKFHQFKQQCRELNDTEFVWTQVDEESFEKNLNSIFEGLDQESFCWDNFDFIQQELKKTQSYQRFLTQKEQNQNSSSIDYRKYQTVLPDDVSLPSSSMTTINDDSFSCRITDSKYASQWGDLDNSVLKAPDEQQRSFFVPATEPFDNLDDDDLLLLADIPESVFSEMATGPSSPRWPQPLPLALASTPLAVSAQPLMGKFSTPNAGNAQNATMRRGHLQESSVMAADEMLLSELDVDMDAFLEPFPEEQFYLSRAETGRRKSLAKENIDTNILCIDTTNEVRQSPDIFALDSSKTSKKNVSLTPPKTATTSPTTRPPVAAEKVKKSPSIFDLYMKTMRVKLPDSPLAKRSKNQSPTSSRASEGTAESPTRMRSKALKRKIFESVSDVEQANEGAMQLLDGESDSDAVAGSQELEMSPRRTQRRKRLRHCSFIEQEAEVDDVTVVSDDEFEESQNHYQLDSMVVQSEDEPEDAPSATQMHAVYLRSMKSPQRRVGTFKMPAYRVYNDQSRIYSQQSCGGEPSQYEHDSFVVSEAEPTSAANASMCPLERAEQILEERRRARRRQAKEVPKSKLKAVSEMKRRIYCLADSSDDE